MQTATVSISIPGSVFESAERLARKLGLSRDELYAEALRFYLGVREKQQRDDVTETLNRVYAREVSDMPSDLMRMQLESIGETW